MHLKPDEMAGRVGDDVTLAALDLFARVIAARPAAFGRLHRLAVDHARRRPPENLDTWSCYAHARAREAPPIGPELANGIPDLWRVGNATARREDG